MTPTSRSPAMRDDLAEEIERIGRGWEDRTISARKRAGWEDIMGSLCCATWRKIVAALRPASAVPGLKTTAEERRQQQRRAFEEDTLTTRLCDDIDALSARLAAAERERDEAREALDLAREALGLLQGQSDAALAATRRAR